MSALAAELAAPFHRDLTRLLEEISAFPGEDLLWRKLPGISNSAGHLMLHLEGNLREYIGRQLGGLSRQPSTYQFLVSLSGHLNYHLGQIDYLRRVLTASGPVPFTQI